MGGQCRLGCCLGQRGDLHHGQIAAVEQALRLQGHAAGPQLRQAEQQAAQATTLAIERDRGGVGATVENGASHVGADALRPQLDEQAAALVGHGRDFLDELHAGQQVLVEQGLHGPRVIRIRGATAIAVDRHLATDEGGRLDRRGQRWSGTRHQLGMECAGDGQRRAAQAGLAQRFHRRFDGGAGAGDHALARTVVVGHADAFEGLQLGLDGRPVTLDRRHGAGNRGGTGVSHRGPPHGRQPQAVFGGNDAGGGQRDVLAIAMACGCLRLQAEAAGQGEIPQCHRADGRLRHAGIGERLLLGLLGRRIEGRGWQNVVGQATWQLCRQRAIGQFQCAANLVEIEPGLAPHIEVLCALAREQEGQCRRYGGGLTIESCARR